MNDVDVDDVAEALYSLSPEEFTAARDEAAAAVTDAASRKAIKALRKPTMSAFAVNTAVRDRPDLADELLALAEELRTAMAGQGGDLRALTERRRDLISSLVDADLPANVRDDVTATFEAATADPQLGAAVRSGRLVKPLRYAGFGELPDLSDAMATPLRIVKPTKQPASKPTKKSEAKRPDKKTPPAKKAGPDPAELDAARQRVLDLSGLADDAQRRYDAASRAAGQARIALEQAEKERAEAHKAAREAHAAAERARRHLGRLERS
jgi:hypothetical protein